MKTHGKIWLGDLDSNQDNQLQRLVSYRWTISQLREGLQWPEQRRRLHSNLTRVKQGRKLRQHKAAISHNRRARAAASASYCTVWAGVIGFLDRIGISD